MHMGKFGANIIHFWLGFLGSSFLLHVLGHLAHFPRWGYTALLCAVKKSQTGTVAALLKIGANIEHEDRCLFKVTLTNKVGRKLPATRIMEWKSSITRYGCTALLLASRWSKTPQIENWPTLSMILSLSCCSLTTLTCFAPKDNWDQQIPCKNLRAVSIQAEAVIWMDTQSTHDLVVQWMKADKEYISEVV